LFGTPDHLRRLLVIQTEHRNKHQELGLPASKGLVWEIGCADGDPLGGQPDTLGFALLPDLMQQLHSKTLFIDRVPAGQAQHRRLDCLRRRFVTAKQVPC